MVSQPSMNDRFFHRSVVMLADHGDDGSFGFIVNKPAKIKLNQATDFFGKLDAQLFLGGPVNPTHLFYVHNVGSLIPGSLPIMEGLYWGGDLTELKEMISLGVINEKQVRFYAGYSGWQPNQLMNEMKENSWIVLDGKPEYVFGTKPSTLWKKIVLTLGDSYAPWVNFPADPTMN